MLFAGLINTMNDSFGIELRQGQSVVANERWWARDLTVSPAALLAAIGLLAAALRFALLDHHSFWFDEAYVYRVTRASWPGLFVQLRVQDAHPPLYYMLMKLWVRLAGDSEVAMRAPSVFFSVATVGLTYMLARRLAAVRVALLAALIAAASPFAIMSSQEARMYPLLGMLTLLSTLSLLACVERGGALRWAGYVFVTAAMAYTHYFGIVAIGAQGLWVICFEHRRLTRWLLAAALILLLYVPWLPSFWAQAANGHGWAWYRAPIGIAALGDLLGLYAFGGSLLGMGNYFGLGSLPPIEQLILLLPFLTILWWGAVALGSRKRSLALVGFPFALPIVLLFVFSLLKPMFYPRWFSFLAPLYAIVLAAGIFELAERFRGRLDRIVAFMVVGLLAYSVLPLARYYLDPNAWPYDWRDTAEFVQAHAKKGDFFLYTGPAAEYSFTYYFRDPHPSLTLQPTEALSQPHPHPTFTPASVQRLSKQYPRMWVIVTVPFTPAMQARLEKDLNTAYVPVEGRTSGYISALLIGAKTPAARGKQTEAPR